MSETGIAWTDKTWNPTTGCTQVSPGCDNCYAKTLVDLRLSKNPTSVRFGHSFEEVMMHPSRLDTVLRWKKPQRIFVNSMSDLFHRDIPDAFLDQIVATMAAAPQHTFQVLTKRPDRMRRYFRDVTVERMLRAMHGEMVIPGTSPYSNIWLGVSIESNDYAWRADMLRETPAAVRFLSIEPMLGPVNAVDFTGIDWVITGGESGRGARPLELDWLRDVRDRCAAMGIPFFLKQLGGATKKRAHDEAMLDGELHVAWPA